MLDKISNYIGLILILAGIIVLLSTGLIQGLFYLITFIPPLDLEPYFRFLSSWGTLGLVLPPCLLAILVGIVILIVELRQDKKSPEEVIKK